MNGQVYKRWDLLNYLIRKFNYQSYLEIGVQSGMCFEKIQAKYKVGVDPNEKHVKFNMTSDDFFAQNQEKFDLIFIDGLHEAPQVFKDIVNSVDALNEGGTIVCHDMLPANEDAQKVPRITKIWNGNCWQAFVQLRASRTDLAMCTVNSDHGLGVIMKGEQDLINIDDIELDWHSFGKHREEWMNIVSYQEFYGLCDTIEKFRD